MPDVAVVVAPVVNEFVFSVFEVASVVALVSVVPTVVLPVAEVPVGGVKPSGRHLMPFGLYSFCSFAGKNPATQSAVPSQLLSQECEALPVMGVLALHAYDVVVHASYKLRSILNAK